MKEPADQYEDIIHLSRPASKRRKMSALDRAAQFSPFAALTGYEAVIRETGRLTDMQPELCDEGIHQVDRELRLLRDRMGARPMVTLTYFQPDEKKSGGAYRSLRGRVLRLDGVDQILEMEDGHRIPFSEICQIQAEKADDAGY